MSDENQEHPFLNIKTYFGLCLKYWYLFVLAIPLCIALGKLYIYYASPKYKATMSILVKDEKSQQGLEDILEEYKLMAHRNIYNEIEILRSYRIVTNTIKPLNFEVSQFVKGNIRELEIYHTAPYNVILDTAFEQTRKTPIYIDFLSDSTFELILNDKVSPAYKFGQICTSSNYSVIIEKDSCFKPSLYNRSSPEHYFIINDLSDVAEHYVKDLEIDLVNKNSSIINVSINGAVVEKEIVFLNKLVEAYLNSELEEKNKMSVNTINFIDQQLLGITDSLRGVEGQLENFRKQEKIVNLSTTADNAISKMQELEEERAILVVKDKYYQYLNEYITKNYDISKIVAPSLMGITDPLLNSLIEELYSINSDQATLGFSAKERNPTYSMLEMKSKNVKKALAENLKNILVSSRIQLDDNLDRINKAKSVINLLPAKERQLVNIERRFNLNDNIYNFLLQKRIEASITKASNTPDNKVINSAKSEGLVSPNKFRILLICVLTGLFLPFLFVYLNLYFNDKVVNADLIHLATSVPIVGHVAHSTSNMTIPVLESPRSQFAESIRSLRVNLQYLASDKNNKVIGITSTIGGEGKTFFALNLAASIALSGAKVIIVGADMRKPRLHSILNLSNDQGLSTFLIRQKTMNEIIINSGINPNLDIITSGPIPPNPTELLESDKFKELMDDLSRLYNYVIIDAAPVGLVADYFLISQYVNANLFMIRHNYSRIPMLANLNELYTKKKIKDLFIVYNDVSSQFGYGYSYGYGGYSYGYGYYEESNNNGLLKWIKYIFPWNKK